MKNIELKGKWISLFLGIVILFSIVGLGVLISYLGSLIFPDWWNSPLDTKTLLIALVCGFLGYYLNSFFRILENQVQS